MRRCVLGGCWARLAFPRAREKKRKKVLQIIAACPAPERGLPAAPAWRPRRASRHRVNENHNDPLTPGALSRWLLWGESRSPARNTAAFKRRFRLQ